MDFIYSRIREGSEKDGVPFPDTTVFKERGQQLCHTFETPEFRLLLFSGPYSSPHFKKFENGDFIAVLGTFFYRERFADEALQQLYDDLSGSGFHAGMLRGQYCVLLCLDSRLYAFNDYLGQYRVFHDEHMDIVSSSFLAVSGSLKEKSLNLQVIREYLVRGGIYGEETVFSEVRHLPAATRICLNGPAVPESVEPEYTRPAHVGDFARMVKHASEELVGWMGLMVEAFGDNIALGLSGGYDSRLLLAALRSLGAKPYVYVYGSPGDPDVVNARMMAEGEGFPLDHRNREQRPSLGPDEYKEVLHRNFVHFDGLASEGFLDNGSDISSRLERASGGRLQLNGGGGEIHRNVWQLNGRSRTPQNLARHLFDIHDYTFFRPPFSKYEFLGGLEEKLRASVGAEGRKMDRRDIERIYPYFRLKYWQAINTSVNARIGPTLVPFLDHRLVLPAMDIPIRYKYNGRFQAALINKIDPSLAAYPSNYGHGFTTIPLRSRVTNFAYRSIPGRIKPMLKASLYRANDKGPYYLDYTYLSEVFDLERNPVSEMVDFKNIKRIPVLNRACGLAYLLDRVL